MVGMPGEVAEEKLVRRQSSVVCSEKLQTELREGGSEGVRVNRGEVKVKPSEK